MKLLNCVNLQIEEFFGSSIPSEYAILSHTWEVGEVTFQDLSDIQAIEDKPGWAKIKRACQLALEQGYSHAWVDTCCIDKTNFTELTEAINSMFKWYARSTVCYAYLADVGGENTIQLRDSRWFTRGWTLQELIAPCRVEFYDKHWKFLGTRADLSDEIQQRTRIHRDFLAHSVDDVEDLLTTIPLGCRMSWAASRVTTREEDLAYCLLGIFGVSMPLLYGEGKKAFIRLQEEIIRGTYDTSLFAWSYPRSEPAHKPMQHYFGILAESPDLFADLPYLERVVQTEPTEYSITNKGLQIMAKASRPLKTGYELRMEVGWQLQTVFGNSHMELGVLLTDQGDGVLVRSSPHIDYVEVFRSTNRRGREEQPLTIRKTLNASQSMALGTSHGSISVSVARSNVEVLNAFPRDLWDAELQMFRTTGLSSFHGVLHFRMMVPIVRELVVVCSLKEESLDEPLTWLASADQHPDLFNAAVSNDQDRLQKLCKEHNGEDLILGEKSGLLRELVGCFWEPSCKWAYRVECSQFTRTDILRHHDISVHFSTL